jgi:hypothetical protein
MLWLEARPFAMRGRRRIRREIHRDRYYTYDVAHWLLTPVNPVTLVEGPRRVVLAPDFTREDYLAADWTLDPIPLQVGGPLAVVTLTEIMGPGLPNPALNVFGEYPAGTYRMVYLEGAHYFSANNKNQLRVVGWRVRGGTVDTVFPYHGAPGPEIRFSASDPRSEVELLEVIKANMAGTELIFEHAGGVIGMWLSDSPYTDNRPAAVMPTFALYPAG